MEQIYPITWLNDFLPERTGQTEACEFNCPRSAGRFCRGYDELRNFLRPRSRFLRPTATLMAILRAAASNVPGHLTSGYSCLARTLTER